jgi:hypothetical protein
MIEAVPCQVRPFSPTMASNSPSSPVTGPPSIPGPCASRITCEASGIEHRLTKPNHPWKNGQFEQMNHTIKEATFERDHCKNYGRLRPRFTNFLAAYKFF